MKIFSPTIATSSLVAAVAFTMAATLPVSSAHAGQNFNSQASSSTTKTEAAATVNAKKDEKKKKKKSGSYPSGKGS